MGYSASRGRRPLERASKIVHSGIINNPAVQAFLEQCSPPRPPEPSSLSDLLVPVEEAGSNIKAVIAVDGGLNETFVQKEFPSASLAFMTFGPVYLSMDVLGDLDEMPFIGPEDMAALRSLSRYDAVVPTRVIPVKGTKCFSEGVRRSIHLALQQRDGRLQGALQWLLFRGWLPRDQQESWPIPRCPSDCGRGEIRFSPGDDPVKRCPGCGEPVFLSDALRLYERIDDDLGAGGILGYLLAALEHLAIVHLIRAVWEMKPILLREVLFIKDGPLAFFGTTAPLRTPMRELMSFLGSAEGGPLIRLVGVEKSGPFVEHAALIQGAFKPHQALLLSNDYIRRYIMPGPAGMQAYGDNMYFGSKVIYKGSDNDMYVATIPTPELKPRPTPDDLLNFAEVLRTVSRLRCSMYDNALMPVALANRLVSLADVPTSDILARFARDRLGRS